MSKACAKLHAAINVNLWNEDIDVRFVGYLTTLHQFQRLFKLEWDSSNRTGFRTIYCKGSDVGLFRELLRKTTKFPIISLFR